MTRSGTPTSRAAQTIDQATWRMKGSSVAMFLAVGSCGICLPEQPGARPARVSERGGPDQVNALASVTAAAVRVPGDLGVGQLIPSVCESIVHKPLSPVDTLQCDLECACAFAPPTPAPRQSFKERACARNPPARILGTGRARDTDLGMLWCG